MTRPLKRWRTPASVRHMPMPTHTRTALTLWCTFSLVTLLFQEPASVPNERRALAAMVLCAVAAFVTRQTLWLRTTTPDVNARTAARPLLLALVAAVGASAPSFLLLRQAPWSLRPTLWAAVSMGVAFAWVLSLLRQPVRPVEQSPTRLTIATFASSAIVAGAAGGVWAHLRFLDVEQVKAGDFSRQLAAVLVVETLLLAPAATLRTRQALLQRLVVLPRVVPAPALPFVAPLVLGLALSVFALIVGAWLLPDLSGVAAAQLKTAACTLTGGAMGALAAFRTARAWQIGLAEGQDPPDLKAIFRRARLG